MEQSLKSESLQTLVKTLGDENEKLYHQLNHLMIRNNTLLKRIDDLQQVINDLHIRLEESNLINNNLLLSNDRRKGSLDNFRAPVSMLQRQEEVGNGLDIEDLYQRWKTYPGQEAKNAPNLRKQAAMLACLYSHGNLKASDLFRLSDTGAVTGARYVASLKKTGLIEYTGARKKGQYNLTNKGRSFVESGPGEMDNEPNTLLVGIPLDEGIGIATANNFDHFDL